MPFRAHSDGELSDYLSLDQYLIKNKDASFLLQVRGESMLDNGILPGDLLIVERGKKPKMGDIVVVYEDDQYEMKYFYRGLRIEAVVTGVVRSYL